MNANPSTIYTGASSTLTWVSQGATSCTALWTNSTAAAGSQVVFPATTTVYSILCSNSGSVASATTTITVLATTTGNNPTPTLSLTANPALITLGSTSALTWNSQNTTYCTAGWTALNSVSGTQSVSPATTTSYTMTCGGQYGTTTATTTVTVTTGGGNNPTPVFPICGLSAQTGRTIVTFPQSEKLWNAFQHTSPKNVNLAPGNYKVSLHSYDGYTNRVNETQPDETWFVKFFDANGNVIASSSKSTDLQDMIMETERIETVNNSLTLTATATTIEGWHGPYPDIAGANSVNPVCAAFDLISGNGGNNPTPSVTLTANPSTIANGASSTLSWTSSNTNYCSAVWTTATSTSGSQSVSPSSTTDYAITCGGQYGSTTATTTVTVTTGGGGGNPTPSVTLVANPVSIVLGSTSALSWTSSNTSYCAALWTTATSTSGSQTVSPATTTDYAISCGGQYGTTTATTTVTVTTGNNNGGGSNPTPSITLTANPGTIVLGSTSTLSWTSSNTNYCSAAWTATTTTSGSQDVAPGATTDYAISCGGQYGTTTATTTVTVTTGGSNGGEGGGGGGGGGGGSSIPGGRRRDISNLLSGGGQVLGDSTCSYLRDYLRIDWENDPIEVMKLQSFLNIFQGEKLAVDGRFDQVTYDATSRFQNQYFGDILEPWGHTGPTGFVYILTKKKVNEIYCNTSITLTADQQSEILAFRSYLASIGGDYRGTGYTGGIIGEVPGFSVGSTSSTSTGIAGSDTTSTSSSGILISSAKRIKDRLAGALGFMGGNEAISLLSVPDSTREAFRSGLQLLGILALIYAITSLLFADEGNRRNKLWFATGLMLLALILVILLSSYYLVLPLAIIFLVLLGMLIFGKKDGSDHGKVVAGKAIILPTAKNEKKNEKLESQAEETKIENAVQEELSNQPSNSR